LSEHINKNFKPKYAKKCVIFVERPGKIAEQWGGSRPPCLRRLDAQPLDLRVSPPDEFLAKNLIEVVNKKDGKPST